MLGVQIDMKNTSHGDHLLFLTGKGYMIFSPSPSRTCQPKVNQIPYSLPPQFKIF